MSRFEPSEASANYGYGAGVDPALISQLITTSAQVADTAITASHRKGSGKRRHKAKMEEIEAAEPDHSPMWPIGIGLGLLGAAAVYIGTRRPKAA